MADEKTLKEQIANLPRTDWGRYKLEEKENEEKLRKALLNPFSAVKEAVRPKVEIPEIQAQPLDMTKQEMMKSDEALQRIIGKKPLPPTPEQLRQMDLERAQMEDMAELNAAAAAREQMQKPQPVDLSKSDPEQFKRILKAIGAKGY